MEAHIEVGESCRLELRHAVLVYGSAHRAFASLHDITVQKEGAPTLGPARPLSLAFLRKIAEGLGSQVAAEILPVDVLGTHPGNACVVEPRFAANHVLWRSRRRGEKAERKALSASPARLQGPWP